MSKQKVSIIGAGLVGSLLASYMAKRSCQVDVYERRCDMRKADIMGGRSINLALSLRGWAAVEEVGLRTKIEEIAIPMYGRMIHNMDGTTAYQAYGKENEAIYSVSRAQLNVELMNAAEANEQVNFHFNQKCQQIDLRTNQLVLKNQTTKEVKKIEADMFFGTDGAFSKMRYSMQKLPRFNYSQYYLEHAYKELSIPADEQGKHQLDKNCLHIWPRGDFMLIALPNLDRSFTCTLFAPYNGNQGFEKLEDKRDIKQYFDKYFASATALMPDLMKDFFENPTSSLVTIKCEPWAHNNFLLLGDASHAIVPFYGQGMNSGFEDCRLLNTFFDRQFDNWENMFAAYSLERKNDADAISDLALYNFVEMRDSVANPDFLLRKKIEKALMKKFPNEYIPVYSMVTFSHIPYSTALAEHKRQERIFSELLKTPDISKIWETEQFLKHAIKALANNR